MIIYVSGINPDDSLPDRELTKRIRAMFKLPHSSYGSRRIVEQLRAEDYQIGRYKIRRLMRQLSLKAKMRRRFKVTTDSRHAFPVAPNDSQSPL